MDLSQEWQKIHKSHKDRSLELLELLPETNDLTLITLKGHLAIEARLNHIIESYCHRPEHLKKSRLSFSQRVHLVKALIPLPEEITCFQEILDLNKLRNKLAHELAPKKVEQLATKFAKSCNVPEVQRRLSMHNEELPLTKQVALAIAQLLGKLEIIGSMSELLNKRLIESSMISK